MEKTRLKKTAVSGMIAFCLALQGYLALATQPGYPGSFYWPFMDYPMYSPPHYSSAIVERYVIFADVEGEGRVRVEPKDLHLNFFMFLAGPVAAMQASDREKLKTFARMYADHKGKRVEAFHLENHALVLRDKRLKRIGPVPLKTVRMEEA